MLNFKPLKKLKEDYYEKNYNFINDRSLSYRINLCQSSPE